MGFRDEGSRIGVQCLGFRVRFRCPWRRVRCSRFRVESRKGGLFSSLSSFSGCRVQGLRGGYKAQMGSLARCGSESGEGVSYLGSRPSGLGDRGFGFLVPGCGFRVAGSEIRGSGPGFRVLGMGYRV